ncbi:ABC transporter permease [Spongiactinospora gelatinilytica]|uniref:ABC transporter permease n=1 Tax=Spongiactinospora gelatinilytica TaxID=2666298 RepID=A0A2W2G037_9ACTN|nr:ABC transporter permease [Spongiactinospora gelatinilytica]PZG41421.1 ABC transporter permease [Spongiactinospora gelatinilytica]
MNILRSEWTKLRSVRSTWIAAVSAVLSSVVLGVVGSFDLLGAPPAEPPAGWDPTALALKGFLFAQLIIGMMGALSVTPEYDTGMIGTSLAVVPARSRLLGAKMVVVAAVGFVTGLVTTLVSFTVVQLMLGGTGLPMAGLSDPGVAGALAGGVLYLTLIALIGVAVGVLTRSATGGLAVLVGALLLVPALAPAFGDRLAALWPITAGQAAYTVVPAEGMVAPGVGLAVLVAAAAVVGIAGHVALRARDV